MQMKNKLQEFLEKWEEFIEGQQERYDKGLKALHEIADKGLLMRVACQSVELTEASTSVVVAREILADLKDLL